MALASYLFEIDPLRGDFPVSSIILLNDALGYRLAQQCPHLLPPAFQAWSWAARLAVPPPVLRVTARVPAEVQINPFC